MQKNGKAGIVCLFCDKEALPNTNPPRCSLHINTKKASDVNTVKELEVCPSIWNKKSL